MTEASDNVFRTQAVRAPSHEQLNTIGKSYGLILEQDELTQYQEEISKSLRLFDKLEDLDEPQLPVKYPRTPGHPPKPGDNSYNAWCWRCDIRGASSGKLAGKTIAIKDNIPIAGVPLRNGSHLFHGYTPDYDATVITKILDAGGHIIGKTTCENCCVSGGSLSSIHGPVLNPYDKSRNANGSSSGSAVAVAIGSVDMALGTDQGGSIRAPASACGIVGFKQTWGLVPYTGLPGMDATVDHVGPLTKSVYDCALLLEVLAGYDGGLDPRQPRDLTVPEYTKQLDEKLTGIKIGILKEGFGTNRSETDVDKTVMTAIDRLVDGGAVLEEVSVPMHTVANTMWTTIISQGGRQPITKGVGYGLKGYYPTNLADAMHSSVGTRINDAPPNMKRFLLIGEYLHRNYGNRFYAKCQNLVMKMTQEYDKILETCDCIVMPTLTGKPKPLSSGNLSHREHLASIQSLTWNLKPFNLTGHPAISINAGFSQGLPIGMMIVGKHFDESTVLRIAYAYEQLRDGKIGC
ncbi:amidase-like [Glandiceps talaboti]